MSLTCEDCNCDVASGELNFGYEKGMVLCMSCYHARVDDAEDDEAGITMREKYEIAEAQRSALMNKVIELEDSYKRLHAKYLELRNENVNLRAELRKGRVQ